jgi:parvulin-like peptidyl-prolyl isomerase
VREAQALGLDRGDVIVRRRLSQKIDFLFEGETEEREPTDDELRAYRDAHAADFARAPKITLRHVFVSRAIHGDGSAAVAAAIGVKLDAGAEASTLGDPFLRGSSFSERTESELASILGAEAAHTAATLELDRWSSPVPSSAGLHLVRVSARRTDETLGAELRTELRERWLTERRDDARRRALAERRRGYQVRIEDGALAGGAP